MSTLLTMVNDLRILLREEQITAISATDDLTQALIPLINKASKSVLESRTWNFDKRTDGVAVFLHRQTGTELFTYVASTAVRVEKAALTVGWLSDRITYFRVTNDADGPDLTYQVVSAETITIWPATDVYELTLNFIYSGEALIHVTDATWELFSPDMVLPTTVRKVLSVRDEEQPLQLVFSERDLMWDREEPRILDSDGLPQVVMVGGTGTNTYNADTETAGDTGMVMSIRPPPETQTPIYYSYVYSHPAMTVATDTLSGVPDRIVSLIVDKAFYYCLTGNIEADPVRAPQVMKQYRIDLELAGREDRVTPNRRRILRPVGSYLGRHPNSRWAGREVPSP